MKCKGAMAAYKIFPTGRELLEGFNAPVESTTGALPVGHSFVAAGRVAPFKAEQPRLQGVKGI